MTLDQAENTESLKTEINFKKSLCTSLQVAGVNRSHLRAASARADFSIDTLFNS